MDKELHNNTVPLLKRLQTARTNPFMIQIAVDIVFYNWDLTRIELPD